jgi:hypothetical protein
MTVMHQGPKFRAARAGVFARRTAIKPAGVAAAVVIGRID